MNIKLSIIIPHKDTPQLLQRCLESIPQRDDLEVIIVDDNSAVSNKEDFPGVHRKNTIVYFSKKNLTAGGARNKGLSIATGEWIMFADSDDFYHECMIETVSPFFSSEYDLVFFGMDSVYSDTLLPAKRGAGVVDLLKLANSGDIEAQNQIRYKFLYPSCKLIRRSLVNEYNIRFDEVPASNDTMFGVKIATNTNRIFYNPEIIYCLTHRENSLVTSYKYENLKSRLLVSFELHDYLKGYGKEIYAQSSVSHWLQIRHASYIKFVSDFFVLLKQVSIVDVFSFVIKKVK